MSVDWQVQRSARVCAATGRELAVGETYFSVLREAGETFSRQDFSLEAWPGVDKSALFGYWRTQAREAEEDNRRRLVIDVEAFYTFFASLEGQEEAHRRVFRYLVALILTRKRVLRLDSIEKTPEGDYLLLRDRKADRDIRVFCPEATEEQLRQAQENLNQIFECQTDAGAAGEE